MTHIPDRIRILLIDDDEEDFLITKEIINDLENRRYLLEWCASYTEGQELILKKAYHIYLVDYRLGGENGLDLIRWAIDNGCTAPLILMTGQGDVETDERAMKAGASDYLVKGKISAYELDRAIRYSLKEASNLEEIRKLNAELEDRVQNRTEELFNAMKKLEENNKVQEQAAAEVRKALKKEQELNELKSRFVTIASHEFRTPLSTILSSASLILKYNDIGEKEKLAKHTNRIKSAVTNLTGILNDFLSLSKLEEGNTSFNPSHFNLRELIIEVKEEMVAMLKERQQLDFVYEGEEMVCSDRNIIKNSLLNLVSNAIKYSDHGEILITAKVQGPLASISVKDEGIGIPEKDQPFMFNRFFRAQNAGNIQGTGLGLNIVKRYIELLKGKIYFKSTFGVGTTFFLEIPVTQDEKNTADRG